MQCKYSKLIRTVHLIVNVAVYTLHNKLVLRLLFVLLLHLLKPTYEQIGNAAVIENSNQDSRWMSVPQGTNNHTLGTTQPNEATGGHLNVMTSYITETICAVEFQPLN